MFSWLDVIISIHAMNEEFGASLGFLKLPCDCQSEGLRRKTEIVLLSSVAT